MYVVCTHAGQVCGGAGVLERRRIAVGANYSPCPETICTSPRREVCHLGREGGRGKGSRRGGGEVRGGSGGKSGGGRQREGRSEIAPSGVGPSVPVLYRFV
eukprot:766748-Hanusia_phi.AAC.16